MNKEQLLAAIGNPTFTPVGDHPPDHASEPEPPEDQDRYAGLVDEDDEEEWPR